MWQASNVYGICGFAALGGALFGFDISSMSGVLGTQAYKRYFNHPRSYVQGGITAAMPAGSLVGSLGSSFIADRFSRKVALQVSCFLWIIGSILTAAAQNVAMLCVGRAICGLGIGVASSIVPVYQSEIAPKEIRGRVVSLQQWAITWGILIQYFIQFGAAEGIGDGPEDPNQPTAAFRIPWGIQMVPAVILWIGLYFCPYSPRWLASKDRWDEAMRVLANLHGNGDLNHPKVLAQYQEIQEALRLEKEQAESSFATLIKPGIFKRVILGMSIQMWSQLSGMNIMMSLNPELINSSTSALFTTLQRRTIIFAPTVATSSASSLTRPDMEPLLETSTMVLAPLATIQRAMLRPRPPVPPIRR
ncbi:hypothetical protein VTH82DRAFT_8566 [Thermothelomyces myriococcoides]